MRGCDRHRPLRRLCAHGADSERVGHKMVDYCGGDRTVGTTPCLTRSRSGSAGAREAAKWLLQ